MPKLSVKVPSKNERVLLDAEAVGQKVRDLAQAIARDFGKNSKALALVGIQTRGVPLAHRLAKLLEKSLGHAVPVGTLDITLYRDDVHTIADQPQVKETNLDFDLQDTAVVLVDDVLFTGRTIRSAMNALIDYGRPSCIRLAVLVDRGHRELPIGPDYIGLTLATRPEEAVDVRLKEVDSEDRVLLRRKT